MGTSVEAEPKSSLDLCRPSVVRPRIEEVRAADPTGARPVKDVDPRFWKFLVDYALVGGLMCGVFGEFGDYWIENKRISVESCTLHVIGSILAFAVGMATCTIAARRDKGYVGGGLIASLCSTLHFQSVTFSVVMAAVFGVAIGLLLRVIVPAPIPPTDVSPP